MTAPGRLAVWLWTPPQLLTRSALVDETAQLFLSRWFLSCMGLFWLYSVSYLLPSRLVPPAVSFVLVVGSAAAGVVGVGTRPFLRSAATRGPPRSV